MELGAETNNGCDNTTMETKDTIMDGCDAMDDDEKDVLRDECAIFACMASSPECVEHASIPEIIHLGLTALQHRGQESTGMVTADGNHFNAKHGMGLVANAYGDSLADLTGTMGIGHNRYSTAGEKNLKACQPFVMHTAYGRIAIAHNGELVNAKQLRKKILKQVGLVTESDTEIITQLLVGEPPYGEEKGLVNWISRIKHVMASSECSYSIVVMTSQRQIYAFRDPHGNRPLCLGELDVSYGVEEGEGEKKRRVGDTVFLASSESCSFSSIGARYIREVEPGEIVCITEQGFTSCGIVPRHQHISNNKNNNDNNNNNNVPSFCIFEYVYFARADSVFEGQLVHSARKQCGRQLAIEGPVEADIVSTIPDSATPAARGFSEQSGIPYDDVVVKNRYIGRTFIQPTSVLRKKGITTKFGPLHQNIKDKRVVLIDDSIVRGNTMPRIVHLLKSAGAREVHIRIASPPLKHPCFMGINIPTHTELIANKYDAEQLARHFGADSLVYLSVDGLKAAVSKGTEDASKVGYCTACLTGKYPVELEW
jgi:amidophosphoribosyltransferase